MNESIKIEPISGFPEWLPNMRLVEEQFIDTIRRQYQLYGFTPIETPAVERMEVLMAKGGIQRQIYTLGRPAEGDESETGLGLHFDLTVPLARYVAQNAEKLVFPFRRYQIQKVWRGERAQRGRFREFYQCDIDVIGRGSLDLIHDAEIPCVINSTFTALGLPDFHVRMSNRKVLADLLSAGEVAPDQLTKVLRAIDKTHNAGIDKTREVFGKEGIDPELTPAILDLIQCHTIADARTILIAAGAATAGLDELQSVIDSAVALGMPESRIQADFTIARGLDYYTGTIYETFVAGKENWGSICSGGRYDDLATFFSNQKFPGVGISIGLSRLFNLLVQNKLLDLPCNCPTKVLVTTQNRAYMQDYLGFAGTLRRAGIPSEVYLEPGALRDQFGYAASNGIPFAIIAGESEFEQNQVTVKDLRNRTQEKIPHDTLINYLQEKLAAC
jgi:histidyl-tRNA synthetase